VLGERKVRISLEELFRGALSPFNQVDIRDTCQAELPRKARLTGTQEIPRTALFEIQLRQDETIVRLNHGSQAFVFDRILGFGDEQAV
jgi:hypothetical protein